ncbi:MAG TPA: outer membrane protein assembly factor BamB [Steroidobacteraceae bacterium]|jgi:outer membrane protein assembly factor BamB|nr:outer membrane protein assembly factor BamB [Steroidobacteraceae bacterium]
MHTDFRSSRAPESGSWIRLALCALVLVPLAACSSKKDKAIDPPAELTDFPASLRVQRVWDTALGGKKAEVLRLGLDVATVDGRAYAAGRSGEVEAFDVESGKTLWRARTKAPLSGGTGVGYGLVVVGSSEGEVIALSSADGSERWRVKVNGEVLSAPAVGPNAAIVRTVDGKLHALANDTGKQIWEYEQQVPRLSLRGTAIPVIVGNEVICGFDNGKVVALSLSDGALLWETTVAPARGRTELERLVDIDSAVKVIDDKVYAVSFQGRVAQLALDSGQIWWAQDMSSYRGLTVDEDNVYISTAEGDVVALRRTTGAELWRQKGLAHRGLSAPVLTDDSVVVADFKGYVHWLDKNTGAFAGRAQAGGERISNAPVATENRVLVMNDEGKITAFKTAPIALASAGKPSKAREATSPAPAQEPAGSGEATPPGSATPPSSSAERAPAEAAPPPEAPAAPPAAPAESVPSEHSGTPAEPPVESPPSSGASSQGAAPDATPPPGTSHANGG